jgi:hypothetical protein
LSAFRKHFRVKELAELWGFSTDTIIRLFRNEPGVLQVNNIAAGKRKYITISIPEAVALRVHESLSHNTFQPSLPARNPLRVIRLGDLNTGVAQKPGNVLKLHPPQERPDSKRVA